jgi:5,6-dimethylbenzimidazole synthase
MATQLQRASDAAPSFDESFRQSFAELLSWRRDVRRFLADPVEPALLDAVLDLACLAPSVGNSQPWRFVSVESPARRNGIRANFEDCNARALAGYNGEKAALYAGLKLSGLAEAPVHLAVFADEETGAGAGLGRQTMPETLRYSAVLAVHTLWLAARAQAGNAGRLVAGRLSLSRLSGGGARGPGARALRLAGPRRRLPPGPGAMT